MYYPLGGISEQELQQKAQQLGEQAQVKSPRTRTVLKKLLKKYGNLFITKGMKIAGKVKTEHHIDLKEGYKVQQYPPHRLGMKQKETQEGEVRKLCNMGVITRSSSPWAARMLLVKKARRWKLEAMH